MVKTYILVAATIGAGIALYEYWSRIRSLNLLSVNYNTKDKQLELLIKNPRPTACYFQSTIRRVTDNTKSAENSPGKTMADGKNISLTRRYYTLVGRDKETMAAGGCETKKIVYPIDEELIDLRVGDKMKVNVLFGDNQDALDRIIDKTISVGSITVQEDAAAVGAGVNIGKPVFYAKDLPLLNPVPDNQAFILKKDHHDVVGNVYSLEELFNSIRVAPPEVISFHLNGRNDFAVWIGDPVGDEKLSKSLLEVEHSDPEETRLKLIELLCDRIDELKSGPKFPLGFSLNLGS